MNIFTHLYKRAICIFRGHSHPMFNCFYCKARSPIQFYDNGDGTSTKMYVGWGWYKENKILEKIQRYFGSYCEKTNN